MTRRGQMDWASCSPAMSVRGKMEPWDITDSGQATLRAPDSGLEPE